MQRLPSGMLQEIQWQGEGEDRQRGGGTGEAAEGGQRMGAVAPTETSEAPIAFSGPYFTSPASPSSPLLGEAGPSSPGHERDASGGGLRDRGSSEVAQVTRNRPSPGPGKVRTTWWESSSEEVSSQLLGGRAGTYAMTSGYDFTTEKSRSSSSPTQQSRESEVPSESKATEQDAGVVDATFFPTNEAAPLFNTGTFDDPPLKNSSSECSTPSSAASSFAYLLRRRVDVRLLRKRLKPSQHTKKKREEKKKANSSPPLRSPTYGIPKVVEDSRDGILSDKPNHDTYAALEAYINRSAQAAVTSLKLPPPKQLKKVPSNASTKAEKESVSKNISTSPAATHPPKPAKTKRPGILRASASLDVNELPGALHFRHKRASLSRGSSRESPKSGHSAHSSSQKKHHSSSSRHTPVSPCSLDPLPATPHSAATGKSDSNPFQTDDNYFSTLHRQMTSRAGVTPTLSPLEVEKPTPRPQERPMPQQLELQQDLWPSMSPEAVEKRQKRGSIFSVFGMPVASKAGTPSIREKGDLATPDQPSSPALSKGTPISGDSNRTSWRRMSEDISLPPYFARKRRANASSDVSPSRVRSPGSSSASDDSGSVPPRERRPLESDIEVGPTSPFTPLPPLREDYDRSRRVSIEVPGTPGIHHRPSDTPFPSSEATSTRPNKTNPTPQSKPTTNNEISNTPQLPRKLSLRPNPSSPTTPTAPLPSTPTLTTPSTRKRSSLLREIATLLHDPPSPLKPPKPSLGPLLRRRRRSAIAPIARQTTLSSTKTTTSTSPRNLARRTLTLLRPSPTPAPPHHITE